MSRAGPEGEFRGVVEGEAGGVLERGVGVLDAFLVAERLHFEHGVLGRLQQRVEAAQGGHGQDAVAVFSADVDVAQDVVGDAPDEGDDLVMGGGGHGDGETGIGAQGRAFPVQGLVVRNPQSGGCSLGE